MCSAEERLAALEAEIAALRAEITALRAEREPAAPSKRQRMSRRGLLRAAGAAAAGAATAGALGSTNQALAANGSHVVVGQRSAGTAMTELDGAVLNRPALRVTNYNGGAVDDYSDAFQAYTLGPGFAAVYARNDAAGGYAISAYSSHGLAASLAGGTAPLRLVPGAATGAPSTSGHEAGEVYVDAHGVFYVYGGATPAWRELATTDHGLQSFPNGRRVFASTEVANGANYAPVSALVRLSGSPTGVPGGARTVYAAVQAVPANASARLALGPNNANFNGAVANFAAPVRDALNIGHVLIPLAADGTFQFTSYLVGALYIDVWGYLL